MSQKAPPGSVPRGPQEGPPSSKDVSNPRQKIMKIRFRVFLTTNSVPGDLPEVFTEMTSLNPYNCPRRWWHHILQLRLRQLWKLFPTQACLHSKLRLVVPPPYTLSALSLGQWEPRAGERLVGVCLGRGASIHCPKPQDSRLS